MQQTFSEAVSNPLDLIERIAEQRDWSLDRTNDCEVTMIVEGDWGDVYISLSWRDDLEALLVACTFDAKIPAQRRDEAGRLTTLINGQLLHGHFDIWHGNGSIVFRNSLVLSGGAIANDAQCESLIRQGLESCQYYYPAFQYVCWAGKPAAEALDYVMFETVGEA